VDLGAAPLRREIELLAQRGRLRLQTCKSTYSSQHVDPAPAYAERLYPIAQDPRQTTCHNG
jgi:hypothetical protein